MNIRIIVLLGALAGLSLSIPCSAEETQVEVIAQDFYEENLATENNQLDQQGQTGESLSDSSFDLDGINPDDLLAQIQEFEQENPKQDIPLETKIKIAWELLKIKMNEHKTGIITGAAVLSTAALITAYVAYKYCMNNNRDQAQ